MQSRGLRSDVKRLGYDRIIDADPVGARPALVCASGPTAITMHERVERDRRKPCKIFRGAGDVCERTSCGHARAKHRFIWKRAA